MNFKEFLSFKMMVAPKVMKIYYIIAAAFMALVTIIAAFAVMFGAAAIGGLGGFLAGVFGFFGILIGGVIAQVVFRIFCEILILFFAMHEELVQLRKKVVGEVEPVHHVHGHKHAHESAHVQQQTSEANDNPPTE